LPFVVAQLPKNGLKTTKSGGKISQKFKNH